MQVGAKWLQDWCSRISGAEAAGAQADDTLALAVAQVLLTGKSSEEAAAELFDVFGDASFEPIQQLLQSRWASPVPTACAMLWGCQGWHLSSCCRAGGHRLSRQPVLCCGVVKDGISAVAAEQVHSPLRPSLLLAPHARPPA